ncbi:choline/ethanolamine kinase family protein [Sulfurovum sp. NBC37-1]|uniref:choline/ethanolamine kinase family protein n=1 Tax=Sulfurovum sp. (strain NBC37-1) TaxID=387093 RepID=UPI000158755A|nr:choline/ethanolamine kinase family protein [Sulfurovum sp. NBC37-1]BAF71495.1 conserved hypothetical protein [Sulfurovum sp. NBC37-1]
MKTLLDRTDLFNGKVIEEITLLPEQGYSNENYRFEVGNKNYLLRKFKLADRDRVLEYKIQTMAYERGLAAKPLLLHSDESFMVCEFAEGEHRTQLQREELNLLTETLKILHSLSIDNPPLKLEELFKDVNDEVKKSFEIIERYPKEIVLCHNDPNPKNCLFSSKNLTLIDWEFASMNDRYFDLAAVSIEFELGQIDEAYMLAWYFGREGWEKEKLEAYKVIYKELCKQWFKDNLHVNDFA